METTEPLAAQAVSSPRLGFLDRNVGPPGWLFVTILLAGLGYVGTHLVADLTGATPGLSFPFTLLTLALVIALGFEFVNGFHDTANAVATVIYTNSMPPSLTVVWSGLFNLLGVLLSSGVVAFTIVSLLPVELILQVGSRAGFAMVYALLLAAIIWNMSTWYFGLPSSSSHTLIGSIIGVGLMNQFMAGPSGTSGVDWSQVGTVGRALVLSPLIGFTLAALLLLLCKFLIPNPSLYRAPQGAQPPPWWIRGLLVLTCTGVSFAHGSNDGQKGIGAAESLGLPISTTHTLSSVVAGTMAANRSGLQYATVRNILLTWTLTLPASIALSGLLFLLLRQIL